MSETIDLVSAELAEMNRAERNAILLRALADGRFDFLDFGTHRGQGLDFGKRIGGTNGLGVELNDAKCLDLLKRGYFVLSEDVLRIDGARKVVDFAVCSHVLEHLPDKYAIAAVLGRLGALCRRFIFIEQPYFDADEYLIGRGLRMAHSTLAYHTCHIRVREFVEILWDLGIDRFVFAGKRPIACSDHEWIHSAAAPPNRMKWTVDDLPKPLVKFDRAMWREVVGVVGLDPAVDIAEIARNEGAKAMIVQSTHRA